MSLESTLNAVIHLLDSNPLGFADEIRIIHETDYKKKFLLEPFRDFSTTLSRRYVRLAYDWDKWGPVDTPQFHEHFPKMANLVHEAVHSRQRDSLGDMKFNSKYLLRENDRYNFEIEAYATQIRYFMAFFGLTKIGANRYVQNCSDAISRHYFLGPKYHFGRAYSDLVGLI